MYPCVYSRSDDATCLAVLSHSHAANFHEVGSTATYYQMQEKLHGYTGVSCTICIQVGPWKLFTIRSSGVSAIQGCLSIEVNGRTVGTFRIIRYIVGVHCWGVSFLTGFYCIVVNKMKFINHLKLNDAECSCQSNGKSDFKFQIVPHREHNLTVWPFSRWNVVLA